MANMVIPNEGKILWLGWALSSSGSDFESFSLRLYSNNYTPVDASTLASFTESTFTGYAAVTISRASMPTPTITSDVAYSQRSTAPSFTCTGGSPQDAYGWFLVGATSGKVLAAQKFATVRTMNTGAVEAIDPFKFGLKSLA